MIKNKSNHTNDLILIVVALIIVLALVFVLSGSKKTLNSDEVRSSTNPVAFTKTEINTGKILDTEVYCPKDHSHGIPVCATCKKIMKPAGNNNGLYVCPVCGRVGIPLCPVCGEPMHPAQELTTQEAVR